jgi:hypothetical protein
MVAQTEIALKLTFLCWLALVMVACSSAEQKPVGLLADQKLVLQERSTKTNGSGFEVELAIIGKQPGAVRTIPGHLIQSVADPQGQWLVALLTVRDEKTNEWNSQIWLLDGRQGIYKVLRSSQGMRFAVDDSAGVLCLFDPANDVVVDGLRTPTIRTYKLPTMAGLREEAVRSLKGKAVDAEMTYANGKFFVRFTDDASTDVRIEVPKE